MPRSVSAIARFVATGGDEVQIDVPDASRAVSHGGASRRIADEGGEELFRVFGPTCHQVLHEDLVVLGRDLDDNLPTIEHPGSARSASIAFQTPRRHHRLKPP